MTQDEFDLMEVRAAKPGWYLVTIYVYNKDDDKDASFVKEWFESKQDGSWDYDEWSGKAYVCFIHKAEESNL